MVNPNKKKKPTPDYYRIVNLKPMTAKERKKMQTQRKLSIKEAQKCVKIMTFAHNRGVQALNKCLAYLEAYD